MDPFLAEIRIFAGNFPPKGWALCNGQLLPISQNTALFSLLGTTYGGNGLTTFALPNLQDSAPLGYDGSQGPGLSAYALGEQGGSSAVTLLSTEMPAHSHQLEGYVGPGVNSHIPDPGGASGIGAAQGNFVYDSTATPPQAPMDPRALSIVGGSLPHNNMMPYLALTFIIALQGVYPARS